MEAAPWRYTGRFRVSVVNPKVIKDFAKGLGVKAKNDGLDALTLAALAL